MILILNCHWTVPYEASGTNTYAIEYESPEKLAVDLEEFYKDYTQKVEQCRKAQGEWYVALSASVGAGGDGGIAPVPPPYPTLPKDTFQGYETLDIDDVSDHDGNFQLPDIYTLEAWLEHAMLKKVTTTTGED